MADDEAPRAGMRVLVFRLLLPEGDGRMRQRRIIVRRGGRLFSVEIAGFTLSLAVNSPCTWQARMRSSMMTGVRGSDSSKDFFHAAHDGRAGRAGSISQRADFMAKAWVRSWMTLALSP